jgi:hypothetical protein
MKICKKFLADIRLNEFIGLRELTQNQGFSRNEVKEMVLVLTPEDIPYNGEGWTTSYDWYKNLR